MKLFTSKSSKKSNQIFKNIFNELRLCSGSKSDANYESISYKSMSENIQVPTPLLPITHEGKPLKSCLKKQSARSNLHTRFAPTLEHSFTDEIISSSSSSSSASSPSMLTPEKFRGIGNSTLSRPLSSTTLDSPVLAFSNATYEGSPIKTNEIRSTTLIKPSTSSDSIDSTSSSQSPVNHHRCHHFYSPENFRLTFTATEDEEDSLDCSSSDTTSSSSSSTTIEDLNNQDIYMVCAVPYLARNEKELSIEFAERLKLIQVSPDWCLVQSFTTDRYGYVPSGSLLTVEQFLNDVRYLTRNQHHHKHLNKF